MKLFREALQYYRDRKNEERDKKKLITAKTDFHLLEQLVQKCNGNPDLKIAVFLRDGTRLELTTWAPQKKRDYELINGDYMEVR